MSELAGGGGLKLKHLLLSNSRGSRERRQATAVGHNDDDAVDKTGRQPTGPRAPLQRNVIEHQTVAANTNETAVVGSRHEKKQAGHQQKAPAVSQGGAHVEQKATGVTHSKALKQNKHHKHHKQQSGRDHSSQIAKSSSKSYVDSPSHSIDHMQSKSEYPSASVHQAANQTETLPSASTKTNYISSQLTTTSAKVSLPIANPSRLANRLSFSPDGPVANSARHPAGERPPPSALALTANSTVPSGPIEGEPSNYILLVGLPIYGCIMLALILVLVVKYCKRMKRAFKEKRRQSSAAKGKNSNKIKKFMSSPIGFISYGKVFKQQAGPDSKAVKKGAKGSTEVNVSTVNGELRKALDCRQLTINMEENSDTSTEDSDEQQTSHDGISVSELTNKPPKSKSKSNKLGMLKYSLEYDFNRSVLTVSIHEARELPGMDLNGLSDPYVNVYMSNNKNYQMFRTKIHKRTLNPVFNETFSYQISYVELAKQTLILSVYDYDKLSKHDEIGQLTLPMNSIDLTQRQVNWSELRKMNDMLEGRLGDICLSLRYVPTAGRLNVVILEARQLKKMDVAGLSDPYVKLALMSQGKRLKKKKTSIKKCTLNPHFNESFSFEIPFEQAQKVQLVITVVDYDRIGTSEPIGKITLGCEQATGETEQRHWMDMLASPRRPIARWHTLRSVDFEPKIPVLGRRLSHLISNK